MSKCGSLTQKGIQCKNFTITGSNFCNVHRNYGLSTDSKISKETVGTSKSKTLKVPKKVTSKTAPKVSKKTVPTKVVPNVSKKFVLNAPRRSISPTISKKVASINTIDSPKLENSTSYIKPDRPATFPKCLYPGCTGAVREWRGESHYNPYGHGCTIHQDKYMEIPHDVELEPYQEKTIIVEKGWRRQEDEAEVEFGWEIYSISGMPVYAYKKGYYDWTIDKCYFTNICVCGNKIIQSVKKTFQYNNDENYDFDSHKEEFKIKIYNLNPRDLFVPGVLIKTYDYNNSPKMNMVHQQICQQYLGNYLLFFMRKKSKYFLSRVPMDIVLLIIPFLESQMNIRDILSGNLKKDKQKAKRNV